MRMEFPWSGLRWRRMSSYVEEELNECGNDVQGELGE